MQAKVLKRILPALLGALLAAASAAMGPAQAQSPTQSQPIDRPGFSGQDFTGLAKRLMPSVVNIATRQTVARSGGLQAFPQGSPLNEFNDFFGRGEGGFRRQGSLGSGFIIDPAGY